MNFIVKSYLCNPNVSIIDLSRLKVDPDSFLTNIDNVSVLEKIKNEIDPDYINGVIYIQYGNQIIFDYTMWDLIDQLWSYIITVIKEYKIQKIGSAYFPDQPMRFEMEQATGNKLIFKLQTHQVKEWLLPEAEFLNVLLEEAAHFFSKLRELSLIDDTIYNYEIDRIQHG